MQEIDLNRYLRGFLRWLWLIVVCGIVAAGVGYLAARSMPRIYRSSAVILVGQDTTNAKVSPSDLESSMKVATLYTAMARRQAILEPALKAAHVTMDWRVLQEQVLTVHDNQTLEIRVTANEPERAKAIANEIVHQLIIQSPTMQDDQQILDRQQFIQSQLETLQDNIADGEATIAQKKADIDDASSARAVLDLQDEIQALELKVTGWRSTYASLLGSKPNRSPNSITVLEPAYAALTPISPNVPLVILTAGVAGLVLATGAVALFLFLTGDRVGTPDEMAALGLATLGSIPPLGKVRDPKDSLIAVREPDSATAEAYRRMRANIQFAWGNHDRPVLLITSAAVGEGKTVTSANLAATFAQAGKRTILVDGDLRRPALHSLFGVPNTGGLTELFWGGPVPEISGATPGARGVANLIQRRLRTFLVPTYIPNLHLLPVGDQAVSNPGELVASAEMELLLEALRAEADVIIFDGPPVLPVADTAVLAAAGLGVVLVAEAGKTRAGAVRHTIETLGRAHARILGLVLNRAPGTYTTYPYVPRRPEPQRGFARLLRRG